MMKSGLLVAAGCLALCGCASVQLVDDNAPSIVLKEKQTRNLVGLGTVSVPAGIYSPDFTANNGIYYRAPTHIVLKSLGFSNVERGGIFIPNVLITSEKELAAAQKHRPVETQGHASTAPTARSTEQGIWVDHQERSGGLIGLAASAPQNVRRVEEPFVFEFQAKAKP